MTLPFDRSAQSEIPAPGQPWMVVCDWNDAIMTRGGGLNKKLLRFLTAIETVGNRVILTTEEPIFRPRHEAIQNLREMLEVSQELLGIRIPQFRIEFKEELRASLAQEGIHGVGLLIAGGPDGKAGRNDYVSAGLYGEIESDGNFRDLEMLLRVMNVRGVYQRLEHLDPRPRQWNRQAGHAQKLERR